MTDLEDRIRAALHHRAKHTRIDLAPPGTSGSESPLAPRWDGPAGGRSADVGGRSPRRRLAALAAASLLVVGGVVGVAVWNQRSPATSQQPASVSVPSPWDIDIDDRLAISLDEWTDDTPQDPADGPFLALDESRLPAGIEVAEASSATLDIGASDDASYRYQAMISVSSVDAFEVIVDDGHRESELVLPAVECAQFDLPEQTDVGGIVADTDGSTVCWEHPDGYVVMVRPTESAAATPDADGWTSRQLAEVLSVVEVDQLPRSEPAPAAEKPDDVAIAGELSDVQWAVTVHPGALRAMSLYVAGARTGGFENTRESQPDDRPVATVQEDTITGVPGYGVIVYGVAPPDAARLVATTESGDTARLPVLRRELESFFAVPIPDTVNVTTLAFMADDGTVLTILDMPHLPIGLDGTYNGWLTTRDVSDSLDESPAPGPAATTHTND